MFKFQYIGKFDCLISKNIFENYVENLYNNLKKCFEISWSPKKFVITMEIDPKKKRVLFNMLRELNNRPLGK